MVKELGEIEACSILEFCCEVEKTVPSNIPWYYTEGSVAGLSNITAGIDPTCDNPNHEHQMVIVKIESTPTTIVRR